MTPNQKLWAKRLKSKIAEWKRVLPLFDRPLATIDFETRSEISIKKQGSWIYSKHPSTDAMCLAYKLPGYDTPRLWHPAYPHLGIEAAEDPIDLFAFILAGGLVEAHNAFFERVIWTHVMAKKHGWPEVPVASWRCSASRASAAALPRDLEGACIAMALPVEKDMAGNRLMKKLSKPRKPRKAEIQEWKEAHFLDDNGIPEMPVMWYESKEEFERLWAYCVQDVVAEEALSLAVPELPESELKLWQLDQEMNWRGVKFDLNFAKKALQCAAQWRQVLNKELFQMTGIPSATKRGEVKAWLLKNENLDLPNTQAETVDWYIERTELSGRALRVLEILKQVNKTSLRKYQTMLERTDPEDGRAHDGLMYHGASTGRWTGKGVQVQNFPRGEIEDMDQVVADILQWYDKAEWLAALYGDVIDLLSGALRGAIIPDEDCDLIAADYSAIEARCVLWEAGAETALEVFRRGGDIYCDMATGIYGFEVTKKDKAERQFGKQAILGLGYGMGFVTFLLTCRKYKIFFTVEQVQKILKGHYKKYMLWVREYLNPPLTKTGKKDKNKKRQAAKVLRRLREAREDPSKIIHELALMKYTVDVYRSRYPEVKQMWADQEAAAIQAVTEWEKLVKKDSAEWIEIWGEPYPIEERDKLAGPIVKSGRVSWQVDGGFLCCILPSTRRLRYRDPEVKLTQTSWGEKKPGLRFKAVVKQKWIRDSSYGGKLVENITQATARDIMADAMLRVAKKGLYIPGLTVHDEVVAEVKKGLGSTKDFADELSIIEPWAMGCPITAEADRFARYRK